MPLNEAQLARLEQEYKHHFEVLAAFVGSKPVRPAQEGGSAVGSSSQGHGVASTIDDPFERVDLQAETQRQEQSSHPQDDKDIEHWRIKVDRVNKLILRTQEQRKESDIKFEDALKRKGYQNVIEAVEVLQQGLVQNDDLRRRFVEKDKSKAHKSLLYKDLRDNFGNKDVNPHDIENYINAALNNVFAGNAWDLNLAQNLNQLDQKSPSSSGVRSASVFGFGRRQPQANVNSQGQVGQGHDERLLIQGGGENTVLLTGEERGGRRQNRDRSKSVGNVIVDGAKWLADRVRSKSRKRQGGDGHYGRLGDGQGPGNSGGGINF
jgi:hypothetical protein